MSVADSLLHAEQDQRAAIGPLRGGRVRRRRDVAGRDRLPEVEPEAALRRVERQVLVALRVDDLHVARRLVGLVAVVLDPQEDRRGRPRPRQGGLAAQVGVVGPLRGFSSRVSCTW